MDSPAVNGPHSWPGDPMSELVERVDEFDRLVGGAVEVGESTVDVGISPRIRGRSRGGGG
ncbi:hypothetical protein CP969_19400 [Streptomyces viridosporus T7A]|uniref:Uncharacterized protein n=1 Tax=Streptomyces viridosporus T7A TaxID=665577 RepID=A0ABX6AG37_STRVD|nr:hypothetical protein CP969_19400 [Streptomyces viridosporus T7A]